MSMPLLLSLDSSSDALVLALSQDAFAYLHDSEGGARSSESLLPQARALLAQAGQVWADLDGIAFSAGPGAFTGLRTSCAVAQGLGLALDRPLLPLDSLMLVAETARLDGLAAATVWVMVDARMDEVYAGAYQWQGTHWAVRSAPALYSVPALVDTIRAAGVEAQAWVGNALTQLPSLTPALEPLDPAQQVTRWASGGSRAAALASLARQAWAQGAMCAPDEALPVYVRDKVAQTTAEREAARAERS